MNIQTPNSKRNDPETSHLAGEKITKTGKRKKQMLEVAALVRKYIGYTSAELAEAVEEDRAKIARRLPDARTANLVVNGNARVCTITGSKSLTWYPAS